MVRKSLLDVISSIAEYPNRIKTLIPPKILFDACYTLLYLRYNLSSKTRNQLQTVIPIVEELLILSERDDKEEYAQLLTLVKRLLYNRTIITTQNDEPDVDFPHYSKITGFNGITELYRAYIGADTNQKEEVLLAEIESKASKQIQDYYNLYTVIRAETDLIARTVDVLADKYKLSPSQLVQELSNIMFNEYEKVSETQYETIESEILTDIDTLVSTVSNDIQKSYSLPCFIPELDIVVKGFVPNAVYMLAGTLGTGKSGTLLNIALGLTLSAALFRDVIKQHLPAQYRNHKPIVVYITLENSKELTHTRLAQILFDLSYDEIRNVQDLSNYIKQFKKGTPFKELFAKALKHCGFVIVDAVSSNFGFAELEQKIKTYIHSGLYPVAIVLDYMDEMYVPANLYSENRFKYGIIASGLKSIAATYNLTIITATQLNRKAMESEELTLAYLSESIEHAKKLDYVVGIRSELIPNHALIEPDKYILTKDKKRKNSDELELTQPTQTILPRFYTRVMLFATMKDRVTGSADGRIRYIVSCPKSKFGFLSQQYMPYLYVLSLYKTGIMNRFDPAIVSELIANMKKLVNALQINEESFGLGDIFRLTQIAPAELTEEQLYGLVQLALPIPNNHLLTVLQSANEYVLTLFDALLSNEDSNLQDTGRPETTLIQSISENEIVSTESDSVQKAERIDDIDQIIL